MYEMLVGNVFAWDHCGLVGLHLLVEEQFQSSLAFDA
jgi:hypothetical protein